jgi:hypothetical protein
MDPFEPCPFHNGPPEYQSVVGFQAHCFKCGSPPPKFIKTWRFLTYSINGHPGTCVICLECFFKAEDGTLK